MSDGPTEPTKLAHEAITTEPFEFMTHTGDEGELTLEEAVFQALGAASMCWSEPPHGVFESRRAEAIGQKLIQFLSERLSGDRVRLVQPHIPEYWYVVVRTLRQFTSWRDAPENSHLSPSQYIMLLTDNSVSGDKLRGREIKSGDKLVRLGDYDQGVYWHDIEDELKLADRNGVWG